MGWLCSLCRCMRIEEKSRSIFYALMDHHLNTQVEKFIGHSQNDVLTKVDPRTVTGHTYTIPKQESKVATDKLKTWKKLNVIS